MKLLSSQQIATVLEARLLGYKVSCKNAENKTVSLVLTHVYTGAVFGVSGIIPSDYRGAYGATILAKKLAETIERDCVEFNPFLGKMISITRPCPPEAVRRDITVLTLLAGQ